MKNKIIITLVVFIYILTMQSASLPLFASPQINNDNKADVLKELGLFIGTDKGFELERKPTRAEASVMLVRLLGKEKIAVQSNFPTTFLDVPGWARPFVGYMYNNKLTFGISANEYGSNLEMTANQYLTFVLRAIGYSDSNGDFNSESAIDKAKEAGVISEVESIKYKSNSNFLRGDVAAVSYNALQAKLKNSSKTLIEKLIFDEKVIAEEAANKYTLNDNKYSASGVIANTAVNGSGFDLTINIEGIENSYHFEGAVPKTLSKGIFTKFEVVGGKIVKFNILGNYNYNYGVNGDYNCYLFRVMSIDLVNKTLKVKKFSSEVNYQYGDEYSFSYDNSLKVYDAVNKEAVAGNKTINDILINDYVWLDMNSRFSGSAIKNIVKISVNNMVVPETVFLDTKGVVVDLGIDQDGVMARINLAGYVKTFNLTDAVLSGGLPVGDIKKGNYIDFTINSSNKITAIDSAKTSTSSSASVNIFRIANVSTVDKLIKCYRLKTDGTTSEDKSRSYYFSYKSDKLAVYDVTDKDAIQGDLTISDIKTNDYVWMDRSANEEGLQVTNILKINEQDITN